MLVTAARHSLAFGNLGVGIRGTTRYHISPHEQKAFAGVLSVAGLANTLWRVRVSVFIVAPPFLVSYGIYVWAEKEFDRLQRKQPGQFDHET